jgi:predicted outer membrane protein
LNADTLRPAERAFLVNASESTRQQMRLAEVGVSQAESSEIRGHALQMAIDFRALNESLEGLIRRKGGIPNAPVGGTSENYHRLIESAGVDFDREFLRIAMEANDRALALFEQVASDTRETDIHEFAAAQLPVLRAHRSKLTELKNAAY